MMLDRAELELVTSSEPAEELLPGSEAAELREAWTAWAQSLEAAAPALDCDAVVRSLRRRLAIQRRRRMSLVGIAACLLVALGFLARQATGDRRTLADAALRPAAAGLAWHDELSEPLAQMQEDFHYVEQSWREVTSAADMMSDRLYELEAEMQASAL